MPFTEVDRQPKLSKTCVTLEMRHLLQRRKDLYFIQIQGRPETTAFGLHFHLSYAFTNSLALAADKMSLIAKHHICMKN